MCVCACVFVCASVCGRDNSAPAVGATPNSLRRSVHREASVFSLFWEKRALGDPLCIHMSFARARGSVYAEMHQGRADASTVKTPRDRETDTQRNRERDREIERQR